MIYSLWETHSFNFFLFWFKLGVIANDYCYKSLRQVCPDDNAPDAFPETEEEFKDLCKSVGDF